ncbi:MAG: hypothetical protein WCS30_13915 [Selenomonadaceae bacterium]
MVIEYRPNVLLAIKGKKQKKNETILLMLSLAIDIGATVAFAQTASDTNYRIIFRK